MGKEFALVLYTLLAFIKAFQYNNTDRIQNYPTKRVETMNVVICDDERVYLESISEKVRAWSKARQHETVVMIHAFSSSEDMLQAWERGLLIDMLFMDIQIPYETDGLKIAKMIFEKDNQIPIAFITNYAEYACDGYLVNALRYILKPVTQQAIDDCMNIAWHRWAITQSESIRIETGRQVELVPVRHILLVESTGHHLLFTTADGRTIDARGKLADFSTLLPSGLFVQCHKSFLVNVMYVRKLQSISLLLADGKEIPVGRKYAAGVYELFRQYYQGR